MPFTKICVYQVKPQKTDVFVALMLKTKDFLEKQVGLLLLRLVKRGYHIDLAQIKEGLPPPKITRIVKSVKYMLYWNLIRKKIMEPRRKDFMTAIGNPLRSALLYHMINI